MAAKNQQSIWQRWRISVAAWHGISGGSAQAAKDGNGGAAKNSNSQHQYRAALAAKNGQRSSWWRRWRQ
jgi:hypothetical protein